MTMSACRSECTATWRSLKRSSFLARRIAVVTNATSVVVSLVHAGGSPRCYPEDERAPVRGVPEPVDAPYVRMRLRYRRNLRIYFNSDLQDNVLPVFQNVSKSGGKRFLGSCRQVLRRIDGTRSFEEPAYRSPKR